MKSNTSSKRRKNSLANEQALQKDHAEINSIVDRKIQFAISQNVPIHMAFEAAKRHCQRLTQNAKGDITQMLPTYSEFIVRAIKLAKLYQAAGHIVCYPVLQRAIDSSCKPEKTTIGLHRIGVPSLLTDGKNCFGRIYLTVAIQCASREVLAFDVATKPSGETWNRTIGKIPADSWNAAVSNINSAEEKRVWLALAKNGKELVPAPADQGHADKVLHALSLVVMAATNPAANAGKENSYDTLLTLGNATELVSDWVKIHNRLQRAITTFAKGMPSHIVMDNGTEFSGHKAIDYVH